MKWENIATYIRNKRTVHEKLPGQNGTRQRQRQRRHTYVLMQHENHFALDRNVCMMHVVCVCACVFFSSISKLNCLFDHEIETYFGYGKLFYVFFWFVRPFYGWPSAIVVKSFGLVCPFVRF